MTQLQTEHICQPHLCQLNACTLMGKAGQGFPVLQDVLQVVLLISSMTLGRITFFPRSSHFPFTCLIRVFLDINFLPIFLSRY